MAKQGFRPINLPQGVTVNQAGRWLTINGPKGTQNVAVPDEIMVGKKDQQLTVKTKEVSKLALSFQGLTRSLIDGAIKGVTEGFDRRLEMKGTGYRAEVSQDQLVLQVGFSHPVSLKIPEGVAVKVERNTMIIIQGINKQQVGEFSAKIRGVRPPEPYKGKGIKYLDEVVKLKPGKAAKAAVTAA